METKSKSVKIGKVLKTKKDSTVISLGQSGSKDPKYNYTVQLRVLNNEGKVVTTVTNPWVNIVKPHENAPKSILNELTVFPTEE